MALLFVLVTSMIGAQVAIAKLRIDSLTLVTSTGRHAIEIEVAESNEDKIGRAHV